MPRRSQLADAHKAVVIAMALACVAAAAFAIVRGSPVGWLVAALVLAVPSLALALELLLMRLLATGAVPQPSAGQLAAAWWAETVLMARVFGWRQPFRWDAVPDSTAAIRGTRGVVFVHGYVCNRGFWTPYLQQPCMQGRAFVAVNLEPMYAGIDAYAPTIEAAVREVTAATGVPPLLVCHSMGGLAARAWLRGTDSGRIHHLLTIASPHHGTWLGRISRKPNGRQMRRHSAWLRELAVDEAARPQAPTTCWYSNCDNVVFPVETATLPHADNRFLPGAAHVDLAFRRAVMQHLQALLEASDAQPLRLSPAPRAASGPAPSSRTAP